MKLDDNAKKVVRTYEAWRNSSYTLQFLGTPDKFFEEVEEHGREGVFKIKVRTYPHGGPKL